MTEPGGHEELADDAQTFTSTTADRSRPGTVVLRTELRRLVSEMCGIPQEDLDDTRPLAEYGQIGRASCRERV